MTIEQLDKTIDHYRRLLAKDQDSGLSTSELNELLMTAIKAEREAKQLGLTKLQLDLMVNKPGTETRR